MQSIGAIRISSGVEVCWGLWGTLNGNWLDWHVENSGDLMTVWGEQKFQFAHLEKLNNWSAVVGVGARYF